MKFINNKTIQLDKIMNELDRFVIRFIRILEKHAAYVIVSGYVSLLFGRARSTEDIDIFIKILPKEKFSMLYGALEREGYWCLNCEDVDDIYGYLKDRLAVRFALKDEIIPNFEVKFAMTDLDKQSLLASLTVITPLGNLKISSLERQIAFKRYYLKSDKDIEDAKHIENIFKGHINTEMVKEYQKLLK